MLANMWNDLSDKYPPIETHYLVCTDKEEVFITRYYFCETLEYSKGECKSKTIDRSKGYFYFCDYCWINRIEGKIIAWQFLGELWNTVEKNHGWNIINPDYKNTLPTVNVPYIVLTDNLDIVSIFFKEGEFYGCWNCHPSGSAFDAIAWRPFPPPYKRPEENK